jgi:hypothetical protein
VRAMPVFWVAAVAAAGSDRAPGEIALLVVCCALLMTATAVVLRSARVRGWRPGRTLLGLGRFGRAAPDSAVASHDGPDAEPDALVSGGPTDAEPHEADEAGGPRQWPRARVLASVVAVLLLAVAVGTAVVLAGRAHNPASRPGVVAGPIGPVPAHMPLGGASDPDSKAPGRHPGDGGAAAGRPGSAASAKSGRSSGSGSSGSGSSGSGPSKPGPTPTSSRLPSTPPPAPAIVLPSGSVQLDESGDDVYMGSFVLEAVNGAVRYTVSAPSGESGDYFIEVVDNSSGTVTPSEPVTVVVSVTVFSSSGSPPYVLVTPGGTVQFSLSS